MLPVVLCQANESIDRIKPHKPKKNQNFSCVLCAFMWSFDWSLHRYILINSFLFLSRTVSLSQDILYWLKTPLKPANPSQVTSNVRTDTSIWTISWIRCLITALQIIHGNIWNASKILISLWMPALYLGGLYYSATRYMLLWTYEMVSKIYSLLL